MHGPFAPQTFHFVVPLCAADVSDLLKAPQEPLNNLENLFKRPFKKLFKGPLNSL